MRAVAMDATMLVSSGFHDRTLRVWEAGNQPGTELAGGPAQLHTCLSTCHAACSVQAAGARQSQKVVRAACLPCSTNY